MGEESPNDGLHLLPKVSGFDGRCNDVIYCKPLKFSEVDSDVVVFFGGDVQDFEVLMQDHEQNRIYMEWSLENTSRILQNKFPTSHIVTIRPSRIEYQTYSCFDNFVPGDEYGVPGHTPTNNSVNHLGELLKSLSKKFVNLLDVKLKLIGFSKGCVVLNQFLYEFEYYEKKDPTNTNAIIIRQVTDMYWLDGGHSGRSNTWITSEKIIKSLSQSGIRLHIHVTPYQMSDKNRPWLKNEETIFLNRLESLNAVVHHVLHYENSRRCLHLHFKLLNDFST